MGGCLANRGGERRREDLAGVTIHMHNTRARNHLLPTFGSESDRLLNKNQLRDFFQEALTSKDLGSTIPFGRLIFAPRALWAARA